MITLPPLLVALVLLVSALLLLLWHVRRARRTPLRVSVSSAAESVAGSSAAYRAHLASLRDEHEAVNERSLLGYAPAEAATLARFAPLQRGTACVFARSARLWGAPEWAESLTLEQNAARIQPALSLFMRLAQGRALDGFVIELRGERYCRDVRAFGRAVFFLLRALCDLEPRPCGCMRRGAAAIGDYGWWYDAAHEFCFVTTFAPFYGADHARHAYGAGGAHAAWIVLQPEFSFARRNISCGHEPTDWLHPRSERDRVRVAFAERGQNYVKRATDASNADFLARPTKHAHADDTNGPTAWQIVRSAENHGIQSCYPWWDQRGLTFDDDDDDDLKGGH
jgi:hypothetical protein